jgi:hypothetical protein
MPTVDYDHRAIRMDGKRQLLLSGAIHYPRSTPAMWPALFERSRQAGLNTIETYVFWNLHERQRGHYDFEGRLDLPRFCRMAQEHGFNVILRIGPYICAEINYGGFPAWLREVPGMQLRTYNAPFLREKERWLRDLCEKMAPLFAPNGGPIILAQIENEYDLVAKTYGEEGKRYLEWCAALAGTLNVGVPWIMCVGGTPGVIETMNGWRGHELIARHFTRHPDQPPLWTENWPGWYDTYTHPHHIRPTEDVAWTVAHFFASGGTGMNYYMWHGGTNFNREAMYLQTTSYDYDAPLDEFGLPTTKMNHLARLHSILSRYAALLLNSEPAQPLSLSLGEQQPAYVYRQDGQALAFLCNDDAQQSVKVEFERRSHDLPPHSVTLIGDGNVLMNTARIDTADVIVRKLHPAPDGFTSLAWRAEPFPDQLPAALRAGVTGAAPAEQLKLTRDETDYCWYSARFTVDSAGEGTLTLEGVADFVHVFVDGQRQAATPPELVEDRGPLTGPAFTQHFTLNLTPGEHQLALLCCALGLIKGDWQIGHQNMVNERKGLWGRVLWNDRPLSGPWTMEPGTTGEKSGVTAFSLEANAWRADPGPARGRPLTWWRLSFARPTGAGSLAADLMSMSKGVAWLNGRCIGRYWLASGGKRSEHAAHAVSLQVTSPGQPTQRYYHLPLEWLAEENTLVLFEEAGGDAAAIRIIEVE